MPTQKVQFLLSAFRREQFPKRDLPEIAFAGRSNVGKSSLINALLGHKRLARVSSTPGRTQSINFFLVNEKWLAVDLPGYGFAKVPTAVKKAWQPLIESYLVDRTPLQGVVLIVDIRRDPMKSDIQLKDFLDAHEIPVLLVATKADKLSKQQVQKSLSALARGLNIPRDSIIPFSSQSKIGRSELWKELSARVEEGIQEMKAYRIEQEQARLGIQQTELEEDFEPIITSESE